MKRIVINADDFGLTQSCTEAIVKAFAKNYITDMTMMATGAIFEVVLKYVKSDLDGRVGIQFNLTEEKPLTESMMNCSEFCSNGVFHGHIDRYKP